MVFVWAFTDLGVPLVFGVESGRARTDLQSGERSATSQLDGLRPGGNHLGRHGVALYGHAGWWAGRPTPGAVKARGCVHSSRWRSRTLLIYGTVFMLTVLAVLPAGRDRHSRCPAQVMTPLPGGLTPQPICARSGRTGSRRQASATASSIAVASTGLDVILGVTIAWLVARRPSWLTGVLDGLAMLPLALPGLVLAFGYLTCTVIGIWASGGRVSIRSRTRCHC